LALLLFTYGAVVLEKMEGFNPFDFWSIILTSSRRIGYHRNLPVQATGANAFKLTLCRISRGLEGTDAHIVHNFLRDEIIVEARDDTADQVQAIVKESMENAFKEIIPEVPFIVEIRVADSWG
jgi:DNA polymerase I-like protein with 3'-5' exonuclease and polymerase domains